MYASSTMHHPGRRRTSDESSQNSSQGSVEINMMTQVSSVNDPPIISSYRQAGTSRTTNNVNNRGIFLPTSRIRNNPRHISGQIRNNGHNNNHHRAAPTLHHNTHITNGQQPFMSVTAKYYDDNDEDDNDTEALDSQNNERIQHYSTAHPSTNNNSSLQQQGNRIYIITALLLGTFIIFSGSNISQSIINASFDLVSFIPGISHIIKLPNHRDLSDSDNGGTSSQEEILLGSQRPEFVYEHPYVSSSYYTSTNSLETLVATRDNQVMKNLAAAEQAANNNNDDTSVNEIKTRLAIVRPFCEFDAEALPTTFTCWNALPPCKAASDDIGDTDEVEELEVDSYGELVSYNSNTTNGRNLYNQATIGDRHLFDLVGSDAMKSAKADVFLFYSQTFSENDVAIKAVDAIIDQFFEPGGWSQCFGNIYAIEANIPQELDLYIPSAQEELYNWVNGPNRQFEAAFRIIQSGEWGEYDGFYLMEGDSVPIKAHWLDVVLSEIEVNRPFAILGAQYDGDKWDNFYEKIPISLLHHTNGNAIYNTSHPLLERLVGQLEVEAPCPYNSIPYDYRMSQMWVEGTLGIVPDLAPKIMLNEEGENITLSDNIDMFKKWAEIWEREDPFKYTPVIHNYAATNLIPRHLGPEYIIHGAKLYSPWDPTKSDITLVVSEWFFDRSLHLISNLDEKDHPFSEVVVMVPPVAGSHDDYDELTDVPVRTQHRGAPDFMDLCEAEVNTEWFMITNSYHHVARHVDLMFTPGTFKPVIPFTPATYAFCFKYPYCKETVNLAQRFNPGQDKVILDMDMLYNTKDRNAFCQEWKEENGEEGEDLYKHQQRRLMFRKKIIGPPGPTGTAYFAWLVREKKDGQYKMTDRSLYGARPPFNKIFAKEEKLDGMTEDELAKRVGLTLFDNTTDCNCGALETELECAESGIGCMWRPLFESCHPPELIDGSEPICSSTEAPTMAPTLPLPESDTESPTADSVISSEEDEVVESDPWYTSMFKSREHDAATTESNITDESSLEEDDDSIPGPVGIGTSRKLAASSEDLLYESDLNADQRLKRMEYDQDEELSLINEQMQQDKEQVSVLLPLLIDKSEDLENVLKQEEEQISVMRDQEMKLKQKVMSLLSRLVGRAEENETDLQQEDDELSNLHKEEERYKSKISYLGGEDDSDEPHDNTPLATKKCDAWEPSLVYRSPTVSNTWNGASLDPESRSHSAMAISRPRKLHGSFLQYQEAAISSTLDSSSPLKESWLTSSVPINVPKYESFMFQEDTRSMLATLDAPDTDRKTFVNYGDGDDYQPLRITFATDHLLSYKQQHKSKKNRKKPAEPINMATISRIETLTGDVLPAISEIWAGALSVLPSIDNIFPYQDVCGEAEVQPHHLTEGFPYTDTLIYVTIDGPHCYTDKSDAKLVSYSTVCSFDQFMRPISANIDICLGHIDVSLGEVSEEENLRLISSLTLEVGKLLGLSPELFHHFRDPETGQPLGSTEKTVTCVDGTEQTLYVPNVLQSSIDLGIYGVDPYFQITTPTVRQVIRNHFDCQSLLGARLSREETSSCFGDSFDPRYHFDDDFTPIGGSADNAFSLSPLTLALLEDSGWYRASFHRSTVPLFGRGAGCGFVDGDCIGEFNTVLPEYSRGFFCNDDSSPQESQHLFDYHKPSGCDYTHNHKADCSSSSVGETSCPMRMDNIEPCADKTSTPSIPGEVFSLSSRCFVTNTPASVCLESYCNTVDSKIDIVVDGWVYQCDYEGQEIDVGPHGYTVRCPRLGVVCPHLVCPSDCSGRGVCDWCQEVPQCVCDDPFDESLGCYGDPTLVTLESTLRGAVDQLNDMDEDEMLRLEEYDDVIIVDPQVERLEHKERILSMLSNFIENEEDNKEEIHEEQISNLHDTEQRYKSKISALLPHLVGVGDQNERELELRDKELSSLEENANLKKAKVNALLRSLISKAEENEKVLAELEDTQNKSEELDLLSHIKGEIKENGRDVHYSEQGKASEENQTTEPQQDEDYHEQKIEELKLKIKEMKGKLSSKTIDPPVG